jgi:hypothetical protein
MNEPDEMGRPQTNGLDGSLNKTIPHFATAWIENVQSEWKYMPDDAIENGKK